MEAISLSQVEIVNALAKNETKPVTSRPKFSKCMTMTSLLNKNMVLGGLSCLRDLTSSKGR